MGSFVGHVDEATVFLLLAFWWMFNAFPRHIKSRLSGTQYHIQVSYSTVIRGRSIPIEQSCKILFPVAGFMAEVIDGHFRFIDEHGNLTGLSHLLHMSLYGIFALHGLIDLLMTCGVPCLPPKFDFITAGVCFFWYSLAFFYHSQAQHGEPLESIIHQIPTYVMASVAIVCFLAAVQEQCFLLDILRCLSLLMLGSWFIHTSYIMYIPGFPGNKENPAWDRKLPQNIHFIPPLFGFHLIMNLVIITVAYSLCYGLVSRRHHYGSVQYKVCPSTEDQMALLPQKTDANDMV